MSTLSTPDAAAPRTKLADWMELSVLVAPDSRVSFELLVSGFELSEERQPEDIGDEDTREDELTLSVQAEIASRRQLVGDDYPFRVEENGKILRLVADITEGGAVYLLCLFLSQAKDRAIVPKKLAPKITNRVRDLFQACATVAAAGYVRGTAVSFGWPRPNKTKFLKALHETYKAFGDGTPHTNLRPGASKDIKDNGVDVIAWRPQADRLPGTQYLLGQAASGADWRNKSIIPDSKHFHEYWFERPPGSQHENALFIPFCLEPPELNSSVAYQDALRDYMQSLSHRYGTVFYRYRIAQYVAEGLQLNGILENSMGRAQDMPRVSEWVDEYRKRLLAA